VSLSARLAVSFLLFLAVSALLSAVAIAGMSGLRGHFDVAAARYDELRAVYEIGHRADLIRHAAGAGDVEGIRRHLGLARREVETVGRRDPDSARRLAARLDRLEAGLAAGVIDPDAAEGTLGGVAAIAGEIKGEIIANRESAGARFSRAILWMSLLLGGLAALGVVTFVVQRRAVLGPIRSLERATRRLARGEFGGRLPERGALELRGLIARFNGMSGEIERLHGSMRREIDETSRQLAHSERLASLGVLAAGVAHEINNPLGIIAGYAESTLGRLELEEGEGARVERVRATLEIVRDEAFRCREITDDLLDLARPRASAGDEPVCVRAAVERACGLARRAPSAVGVEIVFRCAPEAAGASSRISEPGLVQVMINLLMNAVESCSEGGGRVLVAVDLVSGSVRVRVEDRGCGMSAETLARVFDPFFTRKPAGGVAGRGLGLSVSHSIVESAGGRLLASSDGVGRGSVMTLELPVAVSEGVACVAGG